MLRRIAKYLLHLVLWSLIIAAVVWASMLSKRHRASSMVSSTDIELMGGEYNPLIAPESVDMWLKEQDVHPEGAQLSKVDIAAVERIVAEHGAVAEANVYVEYDGGVSVEIEQREPIARLRMSGYDMYLTADGYVLPATGCLPAHVKVVTGDYKPLFDTRFTGDLESVVRDSVASIERLIAELEEAKLPHFKRHIENNKALREVRRSAPKRSIFDSKEKHEILVKAYKERYSEAVKEHSIQQRSIDNDIEAIERAQDEALALKHNLLREAEEFGAMVAMICQITEDAFLYEEVVQIVATGGKGTSLQLAVVPRSGDFTIDLGRAEKLEEKFATLRRFYDKGLSRIGWDRYSRISLRYDGQVVCR
jgi:hypothetical protein